MAEIETKMDAEMGMEGETGGTAEPTPLPRWQAVNPIQEGAQTFFIGRTSTLHTVRRTLLEPDATQNTAADIPVVLYGDQRIGKTAFLHHIRQGAFGEEILCLRLEARQLISHLEPWLWVLDRHLVSQLKAEGVTLPGMSQNSFMTDPAANLRLKVLDVGFSNLPVYQHLLIIIDDVDILLADGGEGRSFLTTIANLVGQYPRLHTLWSSTLPAETLAAQLPNLNFTPIRLIHLSPEESSTFIRHVMPLYLFKEVESYIQDLTKGHPYYLSQFCRLLYEHGRRHNIRQISLVDVATVARSPEYIALAPPIEPQGVLATLSPQPKKRTGIPEFLSGSYGQQGNQAAWRWAIPLVLVVLLVAGVVWQWPALVGGVMGTPTAVALATPEPTEIPVVIPPPAEPTATPTTAPSPTPILPPEDTPTPVVVIITATPEEATITPTAESEPEPEEPALPQLLIRPMDEMPMRLIPEGSYLRGEDASVPNSDFDERPVREVSISAFYMDQYLVNVVQYAAFLNNLGTHTAACGPSIDCARTTSETSDTFLIFTGSNYIPRRGFEEHPMNNISWFGARDYCRWAGGRLPTEAEWEYAARGDDSRLYPWGNELPNPARAVYATTFSNLLPVTALPDGVSPFGIYQMAGSLWQWVNDWYAEDYYEWGGVADPPGAPQGEGRVVRGGAWTIDSTAERIRSANRNWFRPTALRADIGFRCAYDLVNEQ